MQREEEIIQAIKDERLDRKNCNWEKPCPMCLKSKIIEHTLLWVLKKRKHLIGVRKEK